MKLFGSLKKSLSNAKLKMVLAERKDEYVYSCLLGELCENFIGSDKTISSYMNVNVNECDVGQVLGFISASLFTKKRILVLNCSTLKALNRKSEEKKKSKGKSLTFGEELLKVVERSKDDIVVVLSVSDLDKRAALYKQIQSDGVVVECKPLESKKVKELITSNLQPKISADVMDMFLSYVDMDCALILNEVSKLNLLELDVLRKKDIETYVVKSHTYAVYELVNAIADKSADKAMRIFHDIIGTSGAMQIIISLGIQWHRMFCLHVSKGDISKELGMNPYFVKRYREQAKLFKVSKLERGIKTILNAERVLRSEKVNEELLLESLILELCL